MVMVKALVSAIPSFVFLSGFKLKAFLQKLYHSELTTTEDIGILQYQDVKI